MRQPVNKFRYEITNRLGVMQAAPLGEADFTVEWARQDNGNLDYEKEMPSKMVFTGPVFQNLLKLEKSTYRCDTQTLTVQRRCAAGWVNWFSGRINLNDGTWDLDRCELEIKLDDSRNNQCFDDNKSKELNLLAELPFVNRSVYLNAPNITLETVEYETDGDFYSGACASGIYWGGGGDPADGAWAYYFWQQIRETPSSPESALCSVTTRWAREIIIVACGSPSPGPEWLLVSDTCPGGELKYARPPKKFNCVYTPPDYEGSTQINQYSCSLVGDATNGNIIIDNGLPLDAILQMFLTKFCPGITFVSDFFQINPTVVSSINYVTGQPSKVRFLTLFQKSDVKRPNVSGNASRAVITWDKMLDILVKVFNVRWRFEGSTLRMEHVSYFSKTAGFDLTAAKFSKFMRGKRKYSYQNEQIPAREEFKFMEATYGDFEGKPIFYTGGCVTKASRENVKTYTVEKVTTDVELCLSNPNSDSNIVADDGFVLVACDFTGSIYYIISESAIFGGDQINNSLAWAQLHRDYHKWDRPQRFGNMNLYNTQFNSVKPSKKGVKITIPLCCSDTFNPDNTIKTALGTGIVDKATFSFKNETLEIELLYPSEDNLTNNIFPIANNDVVTTFQDVPLIIGPLLNDVDPDGTIYGIEILNPPINGTAVVNADKTVTYTPDTGFSGADVMTYAIFDDWYQYSNPALISITVTNETSIDAVADAYIGLKNTLLTVYSPGVLANDTGVSKAIDSYDAASVGGGTVILNLDGSFTYNPPTGFVGVDTFTYTIKNPLLYSDTATVSIEVRDPSNPVAVDDNYSTVKNTNYIAGAPGVLANDSTAIGTLTAVAGIFATVEGGSFDISTNGSFTYTPPSGFVGNDSVIYTAENGSGSITGNVFFKVTPIIYVKLQQITGEPESLFNDCDGSTVYVGETEEAVLRLDFFSNAGGTVPLDITSVGLPAIIVDVTSTEGNYTTSAPASGTQSYLFSGAPHIYRHIEYNCFGDLIRNLMETFALHSGPYTII